MLAFVDPVSGYTVTIQSYQWGVTEGTEYITRDFGTTPFGAWYRQVTPHQIRTLQVRFAAIDTVIQPLQILTMLVQRHGHPVQFYPDAYVGAYRLIEWLQEVPLARVIENREEVELVLREVGEGTGPPPLTPPTDMVVLALTRI